MNTFFIVISLIGAAVVIGLAVALVVWLIRVRRFRPTEDKQKQKDMLNADLEAAGFAYEPRGDYFYSRMYCWQRKTGYCRLYDEGASLFNMIMDCEPVTFSYGGKRWLIELWKGQYGITTGGEIGVYNTHLEDIHTSRFTGTFYENISDAERLPLSFVLRRNKTVIIKRKALHWWLTGFRLGEFSQPSALVMDAKIRFPNREMCAAFVEGLKNIGYRKGEFTVFRTTVTLRFDKPHSPQPPAQEGLSKMMVQQTNKNNCGLYALATSAYSDTLDKLEFLKATMPELYRLFLDSLYSKAFFDMFEWMLELIYGQHPTPTPPTPPAPPDPPCPPAPPCPPCPPCPVCPSCPPEPSRPCCPYGTAFTAYSSRYRYGICREPLGRCRTTDGFGDDNPEEEAPPCRR